VGTDDREDTTIVTETPTSTGLSAPPTTLYITSTAEPPSYTSTTSAPQTTAVEIFGVIEPNGSTSFGTTQIAVATSTASGKGDTFSTNTGVIIGATVGVVLGVLLLCGVILLLFLRKRRAKKRKLETQYTTQDGDGPAKVERLSYTQTRSNPSERS
jgi:LPXTG-motif cell wall-anchored protein